MSRWTTFAARITRTLAALALLGAASLTGGCASHGASAQRADADGNAGSDHRARAMAILEGTPLIDGHNDAPWQYRRRVDNHIEEIDLASDTSTLDPPMHTDIPRLRAGGVGAQFWSVYIPVEEGGGKPGDARVVLEQIDVAKRLIERYDALELASTADDVERIFRQGKIASMLGMEGGHSIEWSLAVLRATYELGARYMTITHSNTIAWADSATDEAEHGGLTAFGREVIREMNRLGMLVDLSHVSDEAMHDALDVTEAPVIFSHSSCRAVCDSPRNVPDDVIRRTAENGGVVMVTFVPSYVSESVRQWGRKARAARQEFRETYPDDEQAAAQAMREWREANPAPRATIADVADHIDHLRRVAGVDHIGIGGDYDGVSSLPEGLEDVSTYPDLLAELLDRGYTEREIRKIVGENVLRVMREAERVAARLQAERPPSSARIEELDGFTPPRAEAR